MDNKNRFYDPFKMVNSIVFDDEKKVCPNCKTRNDKSAQFCIYCGFDFNEKYLNENYNKHRQSSESESGRLKGLFLESGDGRRFNVSKSIFVIGKDKNNADLHIPNNVVSRIHAKIILENGIYYIVDMDSKNGTYVNGKRIIPNKKAVINHNDVIRFANVDFSVKRYD